MERYQPCPNCASDKAVALDFTWWGGLVGPKMFTHVKCTKCGTTYNGKTGKIESDGNRDLFSCIGSSWNCCCHGNLSLA